MLDPESQTVLVEVDGDSPDAPLKLFRKRENSKKTQKPKPKIDREESVTKYVRLRVKNTPATTSTAGPYSQRWRDGYSSRC